MRIIDDIICQMHQRWNHFTCWIMQQSWWLSIIECISLLMFSCSEMLNMSFKNETIMWNQRTLKCQYHWCWIYFKCEPNWTIVSTALASLYQCGHKESHTGWGPLIGPRVGHRICAKSMGNFYQRWGGNDWLKVAIQSILLLHSSGIKSLSEGMSTCTCQ